MTEETQTAGKWGAFYGSGKGTRYPDENLIRLVRGSWVSLPRSGRALDVGFGTGANLVMLAESGFEAHGLEVAQECLDAANERANQAGVTLHLGLMKTTRLPYSDAFFNLVISWNAIYYWGKRALVREAIQDFHRILRPGGVLLLSVIHPNSWMVRRLSDELEDGACRIDRPSSIDNRLGMDIFYERTSSGWRSLLSDFGEVDEGYSEVDLCSRIYRDAWRIFLACKR